MDEVINFILWWAHAHHSTLTILNALCMHIVDRYIHIYQLLHAHVFLNADYLFKVQ